MRKSLQAVELRQFGHSFRRQSKPLVSQRKEHKRFFLSFAHTTAAPLRGCDADSSCAISACLRNAAWFTTGTTSPLNTANPRYQMRSSPVKHCGRACNVEISVMRSVESTSSAVG